MTVTESNKHPQNFSKDAGFLPLKKPELISEQQSTKLAKHAKVSAANTKREGFR